MKGEAWTLSDPTVMRTINLDKMHGRDVNYIDEWDEIKDRIK